MQLRHRLEDGAFKNRTPPRLSLIHISLGRSKQAVFFSLFRKVVIVAPLTLLLPHLFGLGVTGVFLAEPISNFIGGAACYITMLLTIWREMRRKEKAPLTEQT